MQVNQIVMKVGQEVVKGDQAVGVVQGDQAVEVVQEN